MTSARRRALAAAAAVLLCAAGPLSFAAPVSAAPVCTITGTSGDDELTGTAGADVICGLGGDDVLIGGLGADVLIGGAGVDTASYTGHVTPVRASLDGRRNDGAVLERDWIFADVENLTGGAGNDSLVGNNSVNVLTGDAGNDSLSGYLGADVLDGGAGVDTAIFTGRTAALTLSLDGVANDGAGGENGNLLDLENVVGGRGADTLTGNASANALTGGPGNDVLIGGAGADVLLGGTGTDTVTYAGTAAPVTANLDGRVGDGAAGENDRIGTDVENLTGGTGNDTLTGSGAANHLTGGDGNDTLTSSRGADRLTGGDGNDTLHAYDVAAVFEPGDGTNTCIRRGAVIPCPGPVIPSGLTAVLPAGGNSPGYDSTWPGELSADGRYLAFESDAPTWLAGDTNGTYDVFVRENITGIVVRVSIATDGAQGNGNSYLASMSPDGRFIGFYSYASNLVAGDNNATVDAFLHDRQTGITTRVSVASDGTEGNNVSAGSGISADGRYVAFVSDASNLVPGDTNGAADVFVRDRQAGTTTRVSVATDGTQADGSTDSPSISADGRYVALRSIATNLVPGDSNGRIDAFVHDRQTGTTSRVSVASDGAEANHDSYAPSISADGQYIAFGSAATNLAVGDTNAASDVFVHDRQIGATNRVSLASDGTQGNDGAEAYASLSAGGRYVAFASFSTNLSAGDTNGVADVFVKDLHTGLLTRVSLASAGTQDNFSSYPGGVADSGNIVAFASVGGTALAPDGNPDGDDRMYLWRR